MLRVLEALGALLFIFALPLAIVSSNLRWMVFDRALWERGYERQGVSRATGMSPEQLRVASDQIQAYFNGGPMVSLEVEKEWGRELLFNQKEQIHLADVRDLLWRALRVQEISLTYIVVVAAVLLLRGRSRPLARLISAGATLTILVFGVIGLLAVGNFQDLWLDFHLVSFSNQFWSLDPRTDYMIRMYPEGFWFDMVTDLIGRSAIVAVVLLVVTQLFLRLRPGRRFAAA